MPELNSKKVNLSLFIGLTIILLLLVIIQRLKPSETPVVRESYLEWQKLDKKGKLVANTSGPWKCAWDKETGLLWENKSRNESLTHNSWTYTRHTQRRQSHSREIEGSCSGLQRCHALELVRVANEEKWCGVNNWRVPELSELQSLLDFSYPAPGPMICPCFLPHTKRSSYWSNTREGKQYLGLNFQNGEVNHFPEHAALYLRLVSGPHFESH